MKTSLASGGACLSVLLALLLLRGCGGSGSGGGGKTVSPPPTPPPATLPPPGPPLVRVSGASPFAAGCGAGGPDTLYVNAEVEPYLAVNPANPSNFVGVWQQDRWSGGSAQGILAAASFDGGATWKSQPLPVSLCGGGTFNRASDPWVTFSPNGAVYAASLSSGGEPLKAGSTSAILVLRSADGGQTWSAPVALIHDGSQAFNDKESITADPNDPAFVYAVWDRITPADTGPSWFARTTDGGATWEAARAIYDPGANAQTIGNEIAVLADGTVIDFFLEVDNAFTGTPHSMLRIVRSADRGETWSAPITIAEDLAVGTRDPDTGNGVRDGSLVPQIAAGPGGNLAAVWQDARFSDGQHDGIAISSSSDGGLTWSTPAQINAEPSVPAFVPSVRILADGTIGVSYYDFRDNTADTRTLPTSYWLTQSTDGVNWSESRIAEPFDLNLAPNADGLFVGDYEALAEGAGTFVPFYVQTNNDGTANRTDVYVLPPQAQTALVRRVQARSSPAQPVVSPAFRRRVGNNLIRQVRREFQERERPSPP